MQRVRAGAAVVLGAMAAIGWAGTAAAQSTGCTAAAAGNFDQTITIGNNANFTDAFTTGETLNFSVTTTGTPAQAASAIVDQTAGTNIATAATAIPYQRSYTIPATGNRTFQLRNEFNDPVVFTITCPDANTGGATGSSTSSTELNAVNSVVSKTQTRFTTDNILRHLDVLSSNVLGGGSAPTDTTQPTGFRSDRPPESGMDRVALAVQAETARTHRREAAGIEGGGSFGEMLRQLAPSLNFDTAAGDSLSGRTANAAGDPPEQSRRPGTEDVHFWVYSSYGAVENTRNRANDDQRFQGDVVTVTGGADTWITDKVLAGVALSYSNADLTTDFNDGDYAEDAYTIAPYMLVTPLDWLSLNASVGYTRSEIDQTQTRTTAPIASATDADTVYFSTAATAKQRIGAVNLLGHVGYLRSRRKVDAFTDSAGARKIDRSANSSLLRVGTEVGYLIQAGAARLEPFALGDLIAEFQDRTNGDPLSAEVGGGLKWNLDGFALNGSIEATTVVGHDDYEQWSVRGLVAKGYESEDLFGTVSPQLSLGGTQAGLEAGVGVGYRHAARDLSMRLAYDRVAAPARACRVECTDDRLHYRFRFAY